MVAYRAADCQVHGAPCAARSHPRAPDTGRRHRKLLFVPLPTGNWPGFYDFSNWLLEILHAI